MCQWLREPVAALLVREHLARLGASTQVLDWAPGDVARFERGGLQPRRYASI